MKNYYVLTEEQYKEMQNDSFIENVRINEITRITINDNIVKYLKENNYNYMSVISEYTILAINEKNEKRYFIKY